MSRSRSTTHDSLCLATEGLFIGCVVLGFACVRPPAALPRGGCVNYLAKDSE